jgi:hypothetical protein
MFAHFFFTIQLLRLMDVVIVLKATGYELHGSDAFTRGNVAIVTSLIS